MPITLYEAVLGGKVRVPTLDGSVELNAAAPTSTPPRRCASRARASTATATSTPACRIVLPEKGDPDLESLMRFWRDQKPYKVRD